MTTLTDAIEVIRKLHFPKNLAKVQIDKSLGYVLSEDVYSDINMPPFDKSAMDGYACRKSDIAKSLIVIGFIPAGCESDIVITEETCAKIMTGARVPEGADCVIKIEDTELETDNTIRFNGQHTKNNICYLGEDVKVNQKVLSSGDLIKPASIAVLASVGKTIVEVYKPPKVALIATGDELVEPGKIPSKVQIRNSNAYNIAEQLKMHQAEVNYLGIVNDSKSQLEAIIQKASAEHELVLITGGVSMGDRDYIPQILADEGYHIYFDKLAIQPGRPIVFASKNDRYCFGLSGNPVSSLLQFELIVRPFIYTFMHNRYELPVIKTFLVNGISRKKTERRQFFPVKLVNGKAERIEFHGSAHIASILQADGFGIFPEGIDELPDSSIIEMLLIN